MTSLKKSFDLRPFQSCCAYGLDTKKPVKVTFLDGREVIGLIYPEVYDNPQEMILLADDGSEVYLGRGQDVYDVKVVGEEKSAEPA